jgi:hypothetical protein
MRCHTKLLHGRLASYGRLRTLAIHTPQAITPGYLDVGTPHAQGLRDAFASMKASVMTSHAQYVTSSEKRPSLFIVGHHLYRVTWAMGGILSPMADYSTTEMVSGKTTLGHRAPDNSVCFIEEYQQSSNLIR